MGHWLGQEDDFYQDSVRGPRACFYQEPHQEALRIWLPATQGCTNATPPYSCHLEYKAWGNKVELWLVVKVTGRIGYGSLAGPSRKH